MVISCVLVNLVICCCYVLWFFYLWGWFVGVVLCWGLAWQPHSRTTACRQSQPTATTSVEHIRIHGKRLRSSLEETILRSSLVDQENVEIVSPRDDFEIVSWRDNFEIITGGSGKCWDRLSKRRFWDCLLKRWFYHFFFLNRLKTL